MEKYIVLEMCWCLGNCTHRRGFKTSLGEEGYWFSFSQTTPFPRDYPRGTVFVVDLDGKNKRPTKWRIEGGVLKCLG